MKKYIFIYYSARVERDILSLPKELLAEFHAIQEMMLENGSNLGMPFTKAMSDGLFEIRLSAKDNIARVFYGALRNQEIIILHSFIKKTRATPDKELKLARKRLKEVKHHA